MYEIKNNVYICIHKYLIHYKMDNKINKTEAIAKMREYLTDTYGEGVLKDYEILLKDGVITLRNADFRSKYRHAFTYSAISLIGFAFKQLDMCAIISTDDADATHAYPVILFME